MIRAIFFDFNGVIIDDETIQMKAYEEVLSGHEITLTEELYWRALGMDVVRHQQIGRASCRERV